MLQTLRNAWKIEELRKKILFTLLILALYRLGNAIPVPYVNVGALQTYFAQLQNTVLGLLNVMSGGAFSQATIFALSIQPYINASIIIQLLCIAIPALERMSKEEGEEGRKKIASITRYATVGIGLLQGFGFYMLIKNYGILTPEATGNVWAAIVIILTFTSGSALIMWLGEQITEFGIGNGISMILFASIISRFPTAIITTISNIMRGELQWWVAVLMFLGALAIIVLIVYVNDAERRIPVQYAKRVVGRKMYGGQSTHIPLKLLSVGVLPLIFAYSFMAFPGTIFAMFGTNSGAYKWWQANMHQASPWYMIICALLIIAFSYFYTSITFNPEDIAKNIQQQGGHIPGIRTGSKTVEFLKRTSNRLTLFAALFLAVLSTIPSLLTVWQQVQIPFGASSILIAVSVAIETVRQVESQLVMRNYKGFLG